MEVSPISFAGPTKWPPEIGGRIRYQGFLVYSSSLYLRHGDEHGALLVLLANVGQPAEDHHAHDDHQHEEAQLLVAESYK